jgi:hypothetical protein
MGLLNRYHDALNQVPPPGRGCHASLLSVSNLGVMAGLDGEKIFEDIRGCIPPGNRKVSDREIQDAINKALADHHKGTLTPKPKPVSLVKNRTTTLRGIINQSDIDNEADVWEKSPIRLWGGPQDDTILFLLTHFESNDLIFIGDQYDDGILGYTIRTRGEWIVYFQNGGITKPFIIINPLNGLSAPTKSGDDETFRGDNNVAEFRHCLVEFDNLPREDQIRFWTSAKLPIVALIDSGGKSVHSWIDIQKLAPVSTPEEWETNIKNRLYDRILTPLGVDSACSNPARLSRLPGHFRAEKGSWQRLLWLAPEGRHIR